MNEFKKDFKLLFKTKTIADTPENIHIKLYVYKHLNSDTIIFKKLILTPKRMNIPLVKTYKDVYLHVNIFTLKIKTFNELKNLIEL